ncbi:hypothetical protein EJD97_014279, partial [Solanum chilense]
MHFTGTISYSFYLELIIILLGTFCDADPPISEAGQMDGAVAMPLIQQIFRYYALASCYQDLPHNDCVQCFLISCSKLPTCLPAVSGRVYLDGCFIRYDYYNFFGEATDSFKDKLNCSSSFGRAVTDSDQLGLGVAAGNLIENVTKTAIENDGYAVGKLNGIYGLAQCWRTVSKQGCRECLDKAS